MVSGRRHFLTRARCEQLEDGQCTGSRNVRELKLSTTVSALSISCFINVTTLMLAGLLTRTRCQFGKRPPLSDSLLSSISSLQTPLPTLSLHSKLHLPSYCINNGEVAHYINKDLFMCIGARTFLNMAARTHFKARNSLYMGGPQRFPVPDDKVPWSVSWSEYRPVDYTAQVVLNKPVWADPDFR